VTVACRTARDVVSDMAGGKIQAVRGVINPDKLGHLGEVADLRALLDEKRP
jgi:RNA polymerase sigma-70 factor (ECF subfamily)